MNYLYLLLINIIFTLSLFAASISNSEGENAVPFLSGKSASKIIIAGAHRIPLAEISPYAPRGECGACSDDEGRTEGSDIASQRSGNSVSSSTGSCMSVHTAPPRSESAAPAMEEAEAEPAAYPAALPAPAAAVALTNATDDIDDDIDARIADAIAHSYEMHDRIMDASRSGRLPNPKLLDTWRRRHPAPTFPLCGWTIVDVRTFPELPAGWIAHLDSTGVPRLCVPEGIDCEFCGAPARNYTHAVTHPYFPYPDPDLAAQGFAPGFPYLIGPECMRQATISLEMLGL